MKPIAQQLRYLKVMHTLCGGYAYSHCHEATVEVTRATSDRVVIRLAL